MNVLAIGAHYDDVELGCSGTLLKHVADGDTVTLIVASKSAYKDPKGNLVRSAEVAEAEGEAAAKIMGVDCIRLDYEALYVPDDEELTRIIRQKIEELSIDIVYSHWVHDVHRDHRNLARVTLMASRPVPRVLMYRSNYYDTYEPFRGTFYSDISVFMDTKVEVISAHESELERVRYTWIDFMKRQNANDGQKIGVKYAEKFEVVKYLV
ncbi:PIG-L deacetylase family protein [Pseudodesulfovibrio sediminis]|uniref:GlcNAc-PI de-N-acetylase n=1 Tax=Pseudodesulfovibrio sediminis TaxID=2810563 RepID=A0ABM7P8G0_9BACT|nr:PIG-L deacetylase family protein [Pseudodesulfovibrio sediminis]BCS89195.1 GlcNAc-PI de-N-acetylase [Pseudodesulfovibrio sediminis]